MDAWVGWVIAGAGLILTFAAFFIGRQSAARNDGERWGRLEAMISRQGTDFEKLDKKLDKVIEASARGDAELEKKFDESIRRLHTRLDDHVNQYHKQKE